MNLVFRLLLLLFTVNLRSPAPVLGPCITPFRVLPNDLDVLRHMNNGRYFSILDLARVDLMARSGLWQKLNKAGWYPVVVLENMSFRKSLKVFQRYTVRTTVIGWDEKHILMEQVFISDGIEVASGIVKARFLKKTGGSVTSSELLEMAGISQPAPALRENLKTWLDPEFQQTSIAP
jgi:acyl-CoA thioesterase FadM